MTIIYIIAGLYLIYSTWIIIKISKSAVLNKNQKIYNSLLIFLIPFIWGILVTYIIMPSEKGYSNKDFDKERNVKYYESGKGIHGGSGGGNF